MAPPVRCYSCGKVINNKLSLFKEKILEGESEDEALDSLGIARICCRANIMAAMVAYDDMEEQPEEQRNPPEEEIVNVESGNSRGTIKVITLSGPLLRAPTQSKVEMIPDKKDEKKPPLSKVEMIPDDKKPAEEEKAPEEEEGKGENKASE